MICQHPRHHEYGIVNDNIDFTEIGDAIFNELFNRFLIANIHRQRQTLATGFLNLLGDRLQRLYAPAADHHLGARRLPGPG